MHTAKSLFIIVACVASNLLVAQDKFEKESRIKREDVPAKALAFVDSLQLNTRFKWYQEESLSDKSIEVKFKFNKIKYSIEFDILGNIEDVEAELKPAEMTPAVLLVFVDKLKTDCSSYKIIKIQRQYIGKKLDLYNLLKFNKMSENLVVNYETVVRCKQNSKVAMFEYLFNEQGKMLSVSKITFKNSSHLEY
jgi:hypothetical protein